MRARRPLYLPLGSAVLAGVLLLVGCSSTSAVTGDAAGGAASSGGVIGDGHGEIVGARELAEPALHLTTIDPEGAVHHLDLLDEGSTVIGEVAPADEVVTDGRYLFALRDGSVSVIDSGAWTWSHVDHFHYYQGVPRLLGDVTGDGAPTVIPGEQGIGIAFAGDGSADGTGEGAAEAVLLDAAALAEGEIAERFRIPAAGAGTGAAFVVPLKTGAFVAETGGEGEVAGLRVVDAQGEAGALVPCADAAGSIATVVGVVVGCADGAVLAVGGDAAAIERIPYPQGADAATVATSFAGREGRPTVAARSGETAIWLLDTRERAWTRLEVGEPIVQAVAVDDDAGQVLALAATGAVLVLSAETGGVVSRTEPLVAASLADPALAAGLTLIADQHRAYLNGPAERMLFEIDPADAARIARTFATAHTPLHLAETGR